MDSCPVDRLEVEGQELFAWDEGVEREIDQAGNRPRRDLPRRKSFPL